MPKLSPGYATVSKSIVKICQGDLPKVTDLKGSPKGSMKSSFRNKHYIKPSRSKSIYGNVICNLLALGAFKIYQWSFFKVTSFKCTKSSIRKTIKLIQFFKRIVQNTVKICQWDFLKVAALKRRAALYLELPLQSIPQANYQGNKIFNGIALSVVKFVSETLSR